MRDKGDVVLEAALVDRLAVGRGVQTVPHGQIPGGLLGNI